MYQMPDDSLEKYDDYQGILTKTFSGGMYVASYEVHRALQMEESFCNLFSLNITTETSTKDKSLQTHMIECTFQLQLHPFQLPLLLGHPFPYTSVLWADFYG